MKIITGTLKFIIAIPIVIIWGMFNICFTMILNVISKININLPENADDDDCASIIIPSFNGKDLLEKCIPSLLEAIKYDNKDHEIIIVDNGSDDGTEEFINNEFPFIRLMKIEQRLGFSKACNIGLKESNKKFIILLNNDMIVKKEFISTLVDSYYSQKDVFAVTSQIFFWDETKPRMETGKTYAKFIKGTLILKHDNNIDMNVTSQNILYAGGGSSLYDRQKLLSLGGLDEIFSPFYVEDVDISYRAWKRGWKVLLNPNSIVLHKHRGTIGKYYSKKYIDTIVQKNLLIFAWRNFSDIDYLFLHYCYLILRLFKSINLSQALLDGFFLSLKQIPQVLYTKIIEEKNKVNRDKMILEVSSLENK